jgi:hypothetical protein
VHLQVHLLDTPGAPYGLVYCDVSDVGAPSRARGHAEESNALLGWVVSRGSTGAISTPFCHLKINSANRTPRAPYGLVGLAPPGWVARSLNVV